MPFLALGIIGASNTSHSLLLKIRLGDTAEHSMLGASATAADHVRKLLASTVAGVSTYSYKGRKS